MSNAKGILTSYKAVWQKLIKGKSDLDWLHDTGKFSHPNEFIAIVGNTHGAIKEPIRQGIYARAMELGVRAAEEQGLKPRADKVLWQAISSEAYNLANTEIFLGDNLMTKYFHRTVAGALRGNKTDPGMARFLSDTFEILMPIVNVPTNIAIRTWRLNPAIGLGESAIRTGIAFKRGELRNGAETLSRRDAELITKTFSYGVVGLAMTAYAWSHPEKFGGIHSLNKGAKHNKENGLAPGDMDVMGMRVDKAFAHGPWGTSLNITADAARIYRDAIAKDPSSPYAALTEAEAFMLMAPFKGIPLASNMVGIFNPYYTAGQKLGSNISSRVIPGILQNIAKYMDGKERSPKNFTDEFTSKIPVLREGVPERGTGGTRSSMRPPRAPKPPRPGSR